ncbi:putative beta-lysine N-acetyltransferase [Brevibacillus ginsengisoli]|uniref:putative beta-lysine N-acetyltransferase n=1 Tax=Brevibacillus ginsengisoli TaxID=363854 RepID=UPI003CE94D81
MALTNHAESRNVIVDEMNKRVKVLSYHSSEIEQINRDIEQLADDIEATKLIIYAKKSDVSAWNSLGYVAEGIIDGFDHGRNAHMMSRFLTQERGGSKAHQLAEDILQICLTKQNEPAEKLVLPPVYTSREATVDDAKALAALYQLVFATYPTPMDDPEYVRQTMLESTHYHVIESNGQIVCAASAEVTPEYQSAEITDCATHPDHLGNSLLKYLFPSLEYKLMEMGVFYLYTLTRAQSHGMNITAAKQGYRYRGRLINNCTIFSGFEDMNIWVKPLKETTEA